MTKALSAELGPSSFSGKELLRQNGVSFYGQNQESLDGLFSLLELEPPRSLREAVAFTQSWVRGDHAEPEAMPEVPMEKDALARDLYEQMGLVNDQPLPRGEYDQIIVLGAMQRANNARLKFLQESLENGAELAEGGQIIMWGGPRPIHEKIERPIIDQQLAQTTGLSNPWLQDVASGEVSVNTETDGLRLAASGLFNARRKPSVYFRLGSKEHPIQRYTLESDIGEIVLLNGEPVGREHGGSRHTTESCAEEWLADSGMKSDAYHQLSPRQGARVAFLTHNPHIIRTARDVQNVLERSGRDDVELAVAGAAAYSNARHRSFLGEIARLLYGDE